MKRLVLALAIWCSTLPVALATCPSDRKSDGLNDLYQRCHCQARSYPDLARVAEEHGIELGADGVVGEDFGGTTYWNCARVKKAALDALHAVERPVSQVRRASRASRSAM